MNKKDFTQTWWWKSLLPIRLAIGLPLGVYAMFAAASAAMTGIFAILIITGMLLAPLAEWLGLLDITLAEAYSVLLLRLFSFVLFTIVAAISSISAFLITVFVIDEDTWVFDWINE